MEINTNNILEKNKLEKIFVSSWTQFLNSAKLLKFIIALIKDKSTNFVTLPSKIANKGSKITVSHSEWKHNGFEFWAEFTIPLNNGTIAEGTIIMLASPDGSLTTLETTGNIFYEDI